MFNLKSINYNDDVQYFIIINQENREYKNKYFTAVNTLMKNDRNGSYDEILKDYNYNLSSAYNCLKEVLKRLINDEGLEGEELQFYQEVLKGL